ncbi:MAG TPA: pyridoxal kinase PdxY [Acetobacteraceae bacterium]|nr:pyridoxal kinase PdxY [Acetobacteraceae bacterium]
MKILSLQSWVADGHVGNAAALFPLQRLGAEVAAIHTVQFSNHPGHGAYTGRVFPAADTAALVRGLAAHGTLGQCDAVLSGYIGDAAVGETILEAANQVRLLNPTGLWCCDPVMGDHGRLYVRPGVPEFFAKQAVAAADILTPNQFELTTLTALPCTTLAEARMAATRLRAAMRADGPRLVLLSSLATEETPAGSAEMLLACDAGLFRIRTEELPRAFSGAGDLLAALFLFHVLAAENAPEAGLRAARSLAGILFHTWQTGAAELAIVAAQDELLSPTRTAELLPC